MTEFFNQYNMGDWGAIVQFIYIAVLLLVAKIIKEKVPVINKVILPSALVAGFLGWILSDQALGLFTVDRELLEVVIHHAMGLGFIALALKTSSTSQETRPLTTGAIIATGYLFQAILGTIIIVILFSEYFLGTGFLIALGFSQGPSLAFSIGSGWEREGLLALGGGLGLAIAAIGFLWGGIAGVIINNYHARKNNLEILHVKHEIVSTNIEIESHSKVTFFDALTSQIVLTLLIYGVTFLIVLATQVLLPDEGILSQFKTLFYGLHFLIGVFVAFGFKALQKRFTFKGKSLKFMTNNYLLQSLSSFLFNVMIAASVLVVTTSSVKEYLPFILIATTIAGVLTYYYLRTIVKWQYNQHHHEYTIGLYGNSTGTISTGIALVKMIDPNLEKPVVQDLVIGSGTALFFAIPLLGMLVMPATFAEAGMDRLPSILYIFLALVGYLIILIIGLGIAKRRRKNG